MKFTGEFEYGGQCLKLAELEVVSYYPPGFPSTAIRVTGKTTLRCFNSLRDTMAIQAKAAPVILRVREGELYGLAWLGECSITVVGKNKFMVMLSLICEGVPTWKLIQA